MCRKHRATDPLAATARMDQAKAEVTPTHPLQVGLASSFPSGHHDRLWLAVPGPGSISTAPLPANQARFGCKVFSG